MNKAGTDEVKRLLSSTALWIGGISAGVVIYMALMTLIVSAEVAGLIACGLMLVGVLVFFSWLDYDNAKFWDEFDRKHKR